MSNVQENKSVLESKINEVKSHPMCANLHDDSRHYTVVFPCGDFPVEGIRINKAMGKIKAMDTLLEKMEYFWKSSFPGYKGD